MKRSTLPMFICMLLLLSSLAVGSMIRDEQQVTTEETVSVELNESTADYLIVLAKSEWEDAIVPFAEFKESQGRTVRTITVEGYPYIPSAVNELDSTTGNVNFHVIRNEIIDVWQEEGEPEEFYTLLVGAAEYLSPYFNGYVRDLMYDVTWRVWRDHEYWSLDGNSNTFQNMVGRWPVYNETEIEWLTQRTIAYHNTWGEWTEDLRVWGTFTSDINDIAGQLSAGFPDYTVSTLIGGSAVYDEVTQQFFEDGHSLYFYRGHGGPYLWQGGDYTVKDYYERGLEFPDNYPDARQGFMVSICCSTGHLYNCTRHTSFGNPWGIIGDGSYRNMGEQWVLNRNGGVGFIGAALFMTTGTNTAVAQDIVNGLIDDGVRKFGEIAQITKLRTAQYNLLGDPDAEIIFRAEAPIGVTVNSPSGGEAWAVGDQEEITWTSEEGAYPIDNVDLLYSTNGGASWTTIASEIPDTGSHLWTVPDEPSLECLVRVIVRDIEGNTGQDTSGLFAIVTDPIEVTLLSPNGGEVWNAESTHTISWTTDTGDNTVDYIDLSYSIDGGDSWVSIANGLPDTGSYQWTVPNVDSESCLVRITVYDTLGLAYTDRSDGYFTIIGIAPAPPQDVVVEHSGKDETIILFEEDFTGVSSGSIPSGWTRTSTWWGVVDNNEAGGGAPELRFGNLPSGSGVFRCYTPAIDTSEFDTLNLTFRHYYNRFMGSIILRVQTSTDGSSWSDVWAVSTSSSIPAQQLDFLLDHTHGVGSSTLRVSFTVDGSANNMRRWCVDDIQLYVEVPGDGTEHNLITWDASTDDPGEVIQYNLYRASSSGGPWDIPIANIPAQGHDNYSYLDQEKGSMDEILWWYLVRSVGENTLESENLDPVQEPPTGETETYDVTLLPNTEADGWNFVSFNLIPADTTLEEILSGISGSFDRVMYYDAAMGRWRSYIPTRASRYNNLMAWNNNMGVWIQMNSGATLTVEGYEPVNTDITLYPGWNMVGYPSSSSGTGIPEGVSRVGYFDATQGYNVIYDHNPQAFIFEPGKGYWIYNEMEHGITWTVEY